MPVRLKLIDEPKFSHEGKTDFVDNAIDRSSGTIRARAEFANPDGTFTPGMFGRIQVPAATAERCAAGARRRRSAPSRCASSCSWSMPTMSRARNTSRSGRSSMACASSRAGLEPDDRVIVNGLMRARPGVKVTPQASRRQQRRLDLRQRRSTPRQLRRAPPMRISRFFIDRPIFAARASRSCS